LQTESSENRGSSFIEKHPKIRFAGNSREMALKHRRESLRKTQNIKYLIAVAIALATFLVYLPALQNGFVEWDDDPYVVENIHIRSFDAALLRWAFSSFSVSNWHPLTWISHALDVAVWGLNPLGHHLTNIILHALNTFLVVLLVIRLLEAVHDSRLTLHNSRFTLVAAGTTGLLFGLHPLHVESVAWVAERKDLLCALFFLLSIMAYTKYAGGQGAGVRGQTTEVSGWKSEGDGTAGSSQKYFVLNKHYLFALGFFIFALLSKPMAVTLPVVLLILDWHPFDRIRSRGSLRAAFVEKLPFVALSFLSAVLTVLAQRATMAPLEIVPFSTRMLVAMKSVMSYLGKMLWPADLVPFYPYPRNVSLFSVEYAATTALIIGITVLVALLAKKQKWWMAAWAYYAVTLIPVLGLIQVGSQAMADRYTYLPGLGPFFVAGLITAGIAQSAMNRVGRPALNSAGLLVVIAAVSGISFLTIHQIGVWKDSFSLWDYVIKKEPESAPMGYNGRGLVYDHKGLYNEAIADFNKALALNPSYMEAYNNRAAVFEKTGQVDKAISDYQKAIALYPRRYEAYFNLGLIYGRTGFTEAAIRYFSEAINANPQYAEAYKNRGILRAESGKDALALDDFNNALALDRNAGAVYVHRGNLYLRTGDKGLAANDFQKGCALGEKNGCALQQQMTP
jgi:protein O-mannosyl-transferase